VPVTATAVVTNVTAAHGTRASFLTVYPAGVTPMPTASSVNFTAGQAVANRVTVGVGTGGQIEVYNHAGTVNVTWTWTVTTPAPVVRARSFVPITPVRVADTRAHSLVGTETSIAANTTEKFDLATSASGIPATASCRRREPHGYRGRRPSYLTVYPTADTTVPVASDVNWIANEIVRTSRSQTRRALAAWMSTTAACDDQPRGRCLRILHGFYRWADHGPGSGNPHLNCDHLQRGRVLPTDASSDFADYWTGSAAGGAITAKSCTTSGDVLSLTGTFTLPGSTGGSIVYTAPSSTTKAVYAPSKVTEFAASQNSQ